MKQRCFNEKHPEYFRYGAVGITIDDNWLNFDVFLQEMGFPKDKESLDRINSKGNYCKENCRWASAGIQSFNRGEISTNTSGIKGVYKEKQTNKWKAFIGINGRQVSLGRFCTIEEATTARITAERKYYDTM